VRGHHQSGVEETSEARRVDDGTDHSVQHVLRVGCREDPAVTVRAHATRVGTGIAVSDGLVVLRSLERDDILPVAQRDETDFFAFQKLFDHQAWTKRSDSGFRLGAVLRDDDTLAGRKPVRLDDDGCFETGERGNSLFYR